MTSVLATINPLFEKNQTLTRSIYSTFRRESKTKQDTANKLVSEDKSQTATFDENNNFTVGPTEAANQNLTLTPTGNLLLDKITPNQLSLNGVVASNISNNIDAQNTPSTTLPTSQAVIDYVENNVPEVSNKTYALVAPKSIKEQPSLYIEPDNNLGHMLKYSTADGNDLFSVYPIEISGNTAGELSAQSISAGAIEVGYTQLSGVTQTTGTSTTQVMSQDAVTKALDSSSGGKLDKSVITKANVEFVFPSDLPANTPEVSTFIPARWSNLEIKISNLVSDSYVFGCLRLAIHFQAISPPTSSSDPAIIAFAFYYNIYLATANDNVVGKDFIPGQIVAFRGLTNSYFYGMEVIFPLSFYYNSSITSRSYGLYLASKDGKTISQGNNLSHMYGVYCPIAEQKVYSLKL